MMERYVQEVNELSKFKLMIDRQAADHKAARLEEEVKRLKRAFEDIQRLTDHTDGLPFRYLMELAKITEGIKKAGR